MAARPGPPTTVASYVLGAIRSAILDGRFPAGSRLNQEALAAELGASIIPVRESLRRLEAEGLVTITPRRGAYVTNLSESAVEEIYRIREVLEDMAVRQAVPRLDPVELAELARINEELRALGTGDDAQWEALNRRWHETLYGAAQSPLLLELIGLLWDRCTLHRQAVIRASRLLGVALDDHDQILAACRAGDAEGAAAATRTHIQRSWLDVAGGEPAQ